MRVAIKKIARPFQVTIMMMMMVMMTLMKMMIKMIMQMMMMKMMMIKMIMHLIKEKDIRFLLQSAIHAKRTYRELR